MVIGSEFEKAVAQYQSSRIKEAYQSVRKLLKSHPRHLDSLNLASLCSIQLGRFSDTLSFSTRMLSVQPGLVLAHELGACGRAGLSVASMAAACCMHARISCMICMRYVDQASPGKPIRIPSGGAQLHICIAPYICMCPYSESCPYALAYAWRINGCN